MLNRPAAEHAEFEVKVARRRWNPALHPRDSKGRFIETGGTVRLWGGKLARVVRALPNDRILVQDQTGPNEFNGRRHTTSAKWVSMVARPDGSAPTDNENKVQAEDEKRLKDPRRGNGIAHDDDGDPDTPNDPHQVDDRGRPIGEDDTPVGPRENDDQDEPADGKLPVHVQALPSRTLGSGRFRDTAAVRQHFLDLADRPGQKPEMARFLRYVATDDDELEVSHDGRLIALRDDATGRWYLSATGTGQRMDAASDFDTASDAIKFGRQLNINTGGSATTNGGFDFSNPDLDEIASTWRSPQGENIQAVIKRTRREFDAAQPAPATPHHPNPEPSGDGVTLSPDEVNAPAAAAHAAKAPSAMDDGEIRDEIVSLMEREMANGGELEGTDRTRLRVLEAEEARRAGRKPPEEPKPKPQAPTEEPGGLFDVAPDEQQRFVADPNNPDDVADDATGTPDMFADHEGRDTAKLRAPQSRKPADFNPGDRFVDTDGRTHTVKEPPLRTPRGRIRVVDENGGEHFLAPDRELRVLHPDEDAPSVPEANAPDTDAPQADAQSANAPDSEPPAAATPDAADTPPPNTPDTDAPDAATPEGEPTTARPDQVQIDHTGTGTTIRFPTPNGLVSEEEFGVLRRLSFKASRDRSQARYFYLPSTMTLSRRDDKVRQLKEWLERRNVAYHMPNDDPAEKPELSDEQLQQLRGKYHAPAGTWATTDFRPGDEVWTGTTWDRVDSVGPKNIRLQSWGPTPYDRVLARRRGGEIRTMFDSPADDTTPRPGTDDPRTMTDAQVTAELTHLREATLPEGNEPAARAVRRQVTARIRALTDLKAEREYARMREEASRKGRSDMVRNPARLAQLKGEQVQGTDGELIGAVYPESRVKWRFVDRDGRMPDKTYPTRAAAITAGNRIADTRNKRSGEGYRYTAWDDVRDGDTIRVPELGPSPSGRGRTVTGWSEPITVSALIRRNQGQVTIRGRRGDQDVELEVSRADASFGAAKPGSVPERDQAGGLDWSQMRPDDFGQDERPTPAPDQNAPRPVDEFGTPDLIANGASAAPQASPSATSSTPGDAVSGDETEAASKLRDELPELPELPRLSGLSRQDKDDVRRIRDDYAQIRASLDGIIAGDPPTGDAREDLRRVRQQLDYVAGRLGRDLLPNPDEGQEARAKLLSLGQDLDRVLTALPERDPQPLGDGPNGGTLFHPWDMQDGDLVSFRANDRVNSGLAPFFGTFRNASSSSNGRTLVTYEGLQWNEDRQRWENRGVQNTVVMPQRGLIERFTPEQWDAWQRPEHRGDRETPNAGDTSDASVAPDAPIGQASPSAMSDDDINAELEALEAWRKRHVMRDGEGPRVQGNLMLAMSPVASRKEELHEEQRQREIARRATARREQEKQDRADALKRAEIGKRNEDGSYPVTVDGEDAGSVSQLARKWQYTDDEGHRSPDFYPSRTAATAALVRNRDARRENAAERERRAQAQARNQTSDPAPAPTPAWRHELRARMADIGDDIATLQNREGLQDPERIQRLQDLIQRASRGETDDLQGDLRQIRDEAAWLESQFDDPDLELPYETRRSRSWATAARMKAERDLRYPDFQQGSTTDGGAPESTTPELPDEFAAVRQRYGGDMVSAADVKEGDWVHTVSADPAYNQPMHMVGRVIHATPMSNGQVRIEVESHVTLSGKDTVRTEFAMFPAAGLVERLPEGNPGRDDTSDLARRIAGTNGQRAASKVVVPEGWQAVDGSQVQPRPGDRFRIALRGRGGLTDREHMNVTVERPAEREGYWRVKGQPLSFQTSDIVAVPDGADTSNDGPDADAPNAQGVPDWADDLGDGVALDRPENGAGPRNIYIDGRVEGLLGRERPQGRYYWWRPGGQRSEESFDSPEEAAHAFAREMRENGLPSLSAPRDGGDGGDGRDDRTSRARDLFGEGMNAVGGDSLPEMQELNDRLGRADSADDRDAELRDVADRMDELADQYGLAGPQGELAADRFRRAARVARGEQDDRDERRGDDNSQDGNHNADGESGDGQADTTGTGASQNDDEQQNGQDGEDDQAPDNEQQRQDEEEQRRRSDANPDGGAAAPDGGPDGTGTPGSPDDNLDERNDQGDGQGHGDGPENEDDDQNAPNDDEQNQDEEDQDDEERRRRRRRNRRDGNGGPGGGGPGMPGLPHLRLPDLNIPTGTGAGGGDGRDGDGRGSGRSRHSRPHDVDSLRNAWRTGEGLTAAEDTPERRAHLAELADREGLALSPEGGLATYPEPQADGSTVWRFAQARNGTHLPGITLISDDPEEAQTLAGRFEEITDGNGDPFDWDMEGGRTASVAAWRDRDGRNLPQALRAVQENYERERAGAFTLPEDLTTLSDSDLEGAAVQGLGPEDMQRVMAEMDRRDGYVDQRIRDAVPETPPANAEEAEREGRAMDEALKFGDTDVTQPAPATPGRLRREFDGLDEERFQAAMQATGGRMLSPEAEAQGIDPRAVFSGGKYSNKRAKELASPELNRWFDGDDETPGNGRLTYPQYRQRENDRVLRAEFADWDEARLRQAIDFTNGYFFRQEHRTGDIDERELFSGGSLSANDRWRQYASEELQEWFDNNGGRQTFAQFKRSRQDDDRIERQRYEEEQRRQSAETTGAADSAPDAADSAPDAAPAADDKNTRPSKGGRLLVVGNQAAQDGSEFNRRFRITTPGNGLPVVHDDLNGFRTQKEALDAANALEEHVRDAEGQPFPWDAPDAAERARTFRGPDGETLADSITRVLSEHANRDGNRWQFERDRAQERSAWRQQADEWHRQQEADGYTVVADPNDLQPGDEVSHPTLTARGMRTGPSQISTNRAVVRDGDRYSYATGGVQALGSQSYYGYPAQGTVTGPDGQTQESREARLTFGVVRRKPRPDEVTPDAPADEPQGEPEPIGGQPAQWARVDDLTAGDMVRMTGTTRQGRPVTHAGYVQTGPETVDVTRRGRTMQMLRTWVTENPDGTGQAGNVYTSLNATAARAEAPDDVVPGSPASGAQASLRSGDLPNQIPADRQGNGLFPGSTVSGTNNREGTVTGATNTTVSVHWSDGNDDEALPPTSLTVTDGQRPDGWTADGHRITTQNVVSDSNGALLGPVDDVDGDNVTITTADGTITRSAGDLRVAGEVRDDVPAAAPVTGIDEPAAADLKDGDVVVLDLDGQLATVAITGEPSRDGDRVTLQYADTSTGEIGEIDVDARAVLPRAQGPDGTAPNLGPDDAPEPDEDLVVHPAPQPIAPVTGPTIDPGLTTGDRNIIGDHADGPDDNPDAHQAAVRITADLPVTPDQASALATQLRASADPSTPEGRAALRAADHLDRSAGRTPPAGLNRPRPSNAAQAGEGDLVAMPDERHGDQVRVFRIIDAEDAPGGLRSFLLEDQEDHQWRRRIVHGAMPVWQLPEAQPEPVTPPDPDDTDTTPEPSGTPNLPGAPIRRAGEDPATPAAPDASSTPNEPSTPVARVRPGSLRRGDVIDAPISRTGYQFNGHRRLTIISEPQRNGWWMQLTGVDDDGNVHDFGLHNGRAVNVYDRNRPTPALPPVNPARDPNQRTGADVDQMVSDHARSLAARIIDEAVTGTEPPGDIHALREQIAQRLTDEALRDARRQAHRDGSAALDAAGLTGRDRIDAQVRLRLTRQETHKATVRAALRTINDLEPLDGESNEDLAARARDLLRLIPDQLANRPSTSDPDADPGITNTVTGHADDAVATIVRQLTDGGVDPGDAERIARTLTQQMAGTRQATARRIARRVAAANPDAGRQPGLIARIVAALIRMAKRFAELVKAGARAIAEKYRNTRERLRRLREFLGRAARRVRNFPESRRLARLHRAVNLPDADGDSLAARIGHWAGLLPEPGRFGQAQRRVTAWRPTTWGHLVAGRLPGRSDRIQWTPDRAADGGPGLTGLRHMAALRAAGSDVDQDVTRRLSAALGDDFGDDPHATLQHADDYVASSERRLVNLQAARSSATIPDDEDLEIEITAARAELAAARREYADLRTRYAAAVPDAVAASLADIRDMGPEGNAALVFGPDTNPDAERAVRGVQRLIPRAWLNTPESRRVTAVDGVQGRYEPEGQRITVADLADEGLGTAGFALAQHFARHLGDLDTAQRAFWFTQTHTGRPGARRMRPSALDRLLRRQQTQPETGDTLARSIQAMFSGDWYQDDDLRAFLLGLMATR